MIYIVSGFMRCGTSMMMRALEAGGLEAAYSKDRDARMNSKWGEKDVPDGYVPNDSYYELDPENYQSNEFPYAYEGKLIKCLWGGILRLPPAEYRIIFMRRNVQEIRRSLIAFFGRPHPYASRYDFDAQMDRIVDVMRDRDSVKTIDVVNYDDVIERPVEVLSGLNWPIDENKASWNVKPDKKRQTS